MELSYANNPQSFFRKYAKDLLWMTNSEAGRFLLGIKDKDKIVKLSPNSFHQLRDFRNGKAIIEARFSTRNIVAEIFLPLLTKMEIANREYKHIEKPYEAFLHFSGLEPKRYTYPSIFLVTETFAEADNVTVRTNHAVWATARGGTGATAFPLAQHETSLTAGTYRIDRGFMHFNTAALPDTATITSAFVRINGSAGADADTVTGHIVSSTAASPPTASDWANIGATSFGSYVFAGFPTGNKDVTLDTNGIANISLTGLSKFGLRTNRDIDDSAPTGTNYINITQGNCLISITYTLPSSSRLFASFLEV